MAQTKPKAGQFYGVSNNGTDGQFLKTDGTGGMSWDSPITNPTITSIDYPGSATAADPAGGESVIINGTLFASGVTCTVGGTSAVTAFNSATQITITTPAKAAGQYTVAVTNLNGGTASEVNFIQYSGVPVWSTASGNIGSVQSGSTASFQVTATEGSDTIEYAVTTGTLPTGLSLATATGAITGTAGSVSASTTTTFSITATDDENQTSSARSFNITVTPDLPSNHFNTVLYTGNGASSRSITGVGFAPDFTWTKKRGPSTANHLLQNTVQGAGTGSALYSASTGTAGSTDQYGYISAFGTDGVTYQAGSSGSYPSDLNNENNSTYVAWNFKAGGAAVANTDGTLNTQVSVNNTLGFSIVSGSVPSSGYTNTLGHGLSSAPELIIYKSTNITAPWFVFANYGGSLLGNNNVLRLNDSSTASSDSLFAITSTTFKTGATSSANEFIAYCFTSKPGFSKVGTYTGARPNDVFVQTGFKPAFIMIKATNATDDWFIVDDKREGASAPTYALLANSSAAESSYVGAVEFLTNGFKLVGSANSGGTNNSGTTFMYLAFAADGSTTTPSLANSFATEIYAGNGSSQSITGTGFKPDLIWFKNRTGAYPYQIYNSIRGVDKFLNCGVATTVGSYTGTGAEFNDSGYDLMSFDSNGFTLGASAFGSVNESGFNNVAWCWKAGGTPSINTDGTITSIVSTNDAAGFSVVKCTSPSSTINFNYAHGLSTAPELVIVKTLEIASYWEVIYPNNFSSPASSSPSDWSRLKLNAADATLSSNVYMAADNTKIYNGAWGANTSLINYCFKSISGYSKVGTYTGNGTLGHSISVGFAPGFVMLKMISSSGDWYMFDNKRTTGVYSDQLIANSLATEATGTYVDLTSTGFDLNTTLSSINNNGETFIYLAIKEN